MFKILFSIYTGMLRVNVKIYLFLCGFFRKNSKSEMIPPMYREISDYYYHSCKNNRSNFIKASMSSMRQPVLPPSVSVISATELKNAVLS